MSGHILQQGLARSPLHVEVIVEIIGQLDSGIILKSRIKLLQDVAEGGVLASVIQVEILHQLPCRSLETPNEVQDGLRLSTGNLPLLEVDMDSLSPFLIVLRGTTEKWYVGVFGAGRVQRRRSRRRRLTARRGAHLAGSRSRQGCSAHPPVLSK